MPLEISAKSSLKVKTVKIDSMVKIIMAAILVIWLWRKDKDGVEMDCTPDLTAALTDWTGDGGLNPKDEVSRRFVLGRIVLVGAVDGSGSGTGSGAGAEAGAEAGAGS